MSPAGTSFLGLSYDQAPAHRRPYHLHALPLLGQAPPRQPALGHRSTSLLTVDGLTFKDLDRNGKLDPYEDWRLSPDRRAADLVQRFTLEDLAGLMVHGRYRPQRANSPPSAGAAPTTSIRRGT